MSAKTDNLVARIHEIKSDKLYEGKPQLVLGEPKELVIRRRMEYYKQKLVDLWLEDEEGFKVKSCDDCDHEQIFKRTQSRWTCEKCQEEAERRSALLELRAQQAKKFDTRIKEFVKDARERFDASWRIRKSRGTCSLDVNMPAANSVTERTAALQAVAIEYNLRLDSPRYFDTDDYYRRRMYITDINPFATEFFNGI